MMNEPRPGYLPGRGSSFLFSRTHVVPFSVSPVSYRVAEPRSGIEIRKDMSHAEQQRKQRTTNLLCFSAAPREIRQSWNRNDFRQHRITHPPRRGKRNCGDFSLPHHIVVRTDSA